MNSRDVSPVRTLCVSEIRKSFRSGSRTIEVLRGISFELESGCSMSIRGESGSGKTTLLNILGGLEGPDGGSVNWSGIEAQALSRAGLCNWRRSVVGMVFQAYYLIPEMTAYENVLFAARLRGRLTASVRDRARHLLHGVGLDERLDSLPGTLSGGERQRVAIARALMNRPGLLLADEPTGNLDERTAGKVMDMLLEVTRNEGAALVLATHSRRFANLTDRPIFLHEGRITEESSSDTLL